MNARQNLLVASVVMNVFLAGALAGGIVWLSGKPGPGTSLESAGGQLPDEDRAAFRKLLRQVRHDSRQIILDGQQARREAAGLLQQPVLDVAALSAALERARNADVTIRTQLEQRIVEFAAGSSVEDRSLLAEGLLGRAGPQPSAAAKESP